MLTSNLLTPYPSPLPSPTVRSDRPVSCCHHHTQQKHAHYLATTISPSQRYMERVMMEDWCANSGSANSGSTTKPGRGIRMYMLCTSALWVCTTRVCRVVPAAPRNIGRATRDMRASRIMVERCMWVSPRHSYRELRISEEFQRARSESNADCHLPWAGLQSHTVEDKPYASLPSRHGPSTVAPSSSLSAAHSCVLARVPSAHCTVLCLCHWMPRGVT